MENQGYKAPFKTSKLFEKRATWCGFEIDENGISPKQDKVAAVIKIGPPKTLKEVKKYSTWPSTSLSWPANYSLPEIF